MKKILILFLLISLNLFGYDKDFNQIISVLFKFEGIKLVKAEDGYSKYGLTKYYVKDFNNLTEDKAKEIIHNEIYLKYRLNEIKSKRLRHNIFDWIYNSNPSVAIRKIKTLYKEHNVDIDNTTSKMTDIFIDTLNSIDLSYEIEQCRLDYVKSLKTFNKYGKGWTKRITYINKLWYYKYMGY